MQMKPWRYPRRRRISLRSFAKSYGWIAVILRKLARGGRPRLLCTQETGCRVTTTTISDAQFAYATARVAAGLEDQVTIA